MLRLQGGGSSGTLGRYWQSLRHPVRLLLKEGSPFSSSYPRGDPPLLICPPLPSTTHLPPAEEHRSLVRRQLHALLDAGFGPLDFFSHDIRKWVCPVDQRRGRRTASSFFTIDLGGPRPP